MRKTIKLTIILVFSSILFCGSFLLYSTSTDYQPDEKIVIMQADTYNHVIDSSFTVMTWNIGYAGLGANMDFFYDGGQQVRTSKEHTVENLKQILSVIMAQKNVDFFCFKKLMCKPSELII